MSNLPKAFEFEEWACSFSGCDGGNPTGSIWFSGIEWGLNKKEDDKKYYKKDLPEEIAKGKYQPPDIYDWEVNSKSKYGQNVAKLYSCIIGKQVVAKWRTVVADCNGSEIFKMNLYPISFNNTDDQLWEKYDLPKITGLASKHIYRTWCFLHRFPFISEKVKDYEPKLIIATGITYLTDFVVCFAGARGVEKINKETIAPQSGNNQSTRVFYWAKINEKTTLAVIPFLGGRYGLNSDDLLQKFGEKIREIVFS